jgi:hypothetical protein
MLEEVGDIGGRLRASFGELELVNSCGESRQLTDGSIDVTVGSEKLFPESEIDMGAMSEWEMLGATDLIENNMILHLDGRVIACSYVDYAPTTLSAEDSGTGREELVLELIAICVCDHDLADGTRPAPILFAGMIPISGRGRVDVEGDQYSAYLLVDVARTPLNFDDDEMWIPQGVPQADYHSVGQVLGATIDIELTAPLTLAYVDRTGPTWVLDTSRRRQLSYAHAYGVVNKQ